MPETPRTPRAEYGQWELVPIRSLIVPPDRVRKDFSKLPQLIESIRKVGLLHPLVVTRREDGKYVLNAGESRMRALLLLGWSQAPVTFRDRLSDYEQKLIELEENLKRSDIEWSEHVEGLRQLDEANREIHGSALPGAKSDGWTTEKTAASVNESASGVQIKIKFAKLLLSRPDLKAQLKDLPLQVAIRRAVQIQETERVQRLSSTGMLKLSSDILHGDARTLIKAIPDGSVDLVLTDPPFGITTLDEMEGKDRGTVQSYTSVMKPADNATSKEVHALMLELAPQLVRVLKPGGHVYVFFAFELEQELKQAFMMAGLVINPVPLIWDKGLTTAPFRGYDYSPCYEPILFGYKPPRTRRLVDPGATIIKGFAPDRAELKVHPFQKSQSLLRYFIKQSTLLGQRVLDPFVGSGSTVLAARECGRTGIGFELDEERFHQAQSRLMKGDFNARVPEAISPSDEALSAADERGET